MNREFKLEPTNELLLEYLRDNYESAHELFAQDSQALFQEIPPDIPIGETDNKTASVLADPIISTVSHLLDVKKKNNIHLRISNQVFWDSMIHGTSSTIMRATTLLVPLAFSLYSDTLTFSKFIEPSHLGTLVLGSSIIGLSDLLARGIKISIRTHAKKNDRWGVFYPDYKYIWICPYTPKKILTYIFAHEITHYVYERAQEALKYPSLNHELFYEGIADWVGIHSQKILYPVPESIEHRTALQESAALIDKCIKTLDQIDEMPPTAPIQTLMNDNKYALGYTAVSIATRKHGPNAVRQMFRGNFSCFKV